jgi:tetratricopeptide (TPR) repeat protein
MIDPSEVSAPTDWPVPGPLTLTDGAIAVLNLQAQIDGLEGPGTFAEAATLIDLLILRGLILGRISDYERAAELADCEVGTAITDAAAYVVRARTRAVFHRFTEALDDLDHADRISPQGAAAERERAAILQAMGHYNEALVTHEAAAADREEKFERAAALAGFWAERGKTETAQHFYLDSLRSYRGVSPPLVSEERAAVQLARVELSCLSRGIAGPGGSQCRQSAIGWRRSECPNTSSVLPRIGSISRYSAT